MSDAMPNRFHQTGSALGFVSLPSFGHAIAASAPAIRVVVGVPVVVGMALRTVGLQGVLCSDNEI
jgi:hypothetical protein